MMDGRAAPRRTVRPALEETGFARDLVEGLRRTPKRVLCKYFYDSAGSALFEKICALPEYYQTRTETAILEARAVEIARLVGAGAQLIEFGAGSLRKIRILLAALESPRAYTPIDISGAYLQKVAAMFGADYPGLMLDPLVGDFTGPLAVADAAGGARRIGFFPGSTIGNFTPEEAIALLRRMAGLTRGGGLLIGVDLVKDPKILHAAYNDAQGVTAAFNRNLLARANRELGADFDPDAFDHYAPYNPHAARVEMYLVSRVRQSVHLGGETLDFAPGEPVHTEDSHKYTIEGFRELAVHAGFVPRAVWCDANRLFSVHWLETA